MSGLGPMGAAAQSLLALAFGLAVVVSPLAMISCPHHGVPAAASTATGVDQAHAATAAVAHGESEGSDSGDHEHGTAPCCCLGHCCPGGSVSHPAPDASDILPYAAVGVLAPALDRTLRPTAGPWLLPWPNGPPSIS